MLNKPDTQQPAVPHAYRGKQLPKSQGTAIINEARKHIVFNAQETPIGYHWTVLNEKVQKTINQMGTIRDVVSYAQTLSLSGFESRALASTWRPMIRRYDDIMKSEFPDLYARLGDLGDSPYSRPETLLKYQGRLVSNMYLMYLGFIPPTILPRHYTRRRKPAVPGARGLDRSGRSGWKD
jgi:hypothetical protein